MSISIEEIEARYASNEPVTINFTQRGIPFTLKTRITSIQHIAFSDKPACYVVLDAKTLFLIDESRGEKVVAITHLSIHSDTRGGVKKVYLHHADDTLMVEID